MEQQNGIAEVQRSVSQLYHFRTVKKIENLDLSRKEDAELVQWLWDKVKSQHYAFDDYSRGDASMFVGGLLDASCHHFLIGQAAYCVVRGLYENSTPTIHYVVWDHHFDLAQIREAGNEILDWAFKTYHCHRVSAFIPTYNKLARRVATMLRFRFEGAQREAIRFEGKWWDIDIFGLLENSRSEVVQ